MPSGMGTESLGVIGCMFAENGPLEDGIESSFWGTGWGAKGDFRRIFGPDPFIFEGGPPPFSESTCPQVHSQTFWAHTCGHVLSENGGGPPSKMNGSGPKIRLKSPLAPQPVPQKLASMPPSKGPFSANIHPITPKLSVPIPEGMCFRKMVGGPLRK